MRLCIIGPIGRRKERNIAAFGVVGMGQHMELCKARNEARGRGYR